MHYPLSRSVLLMNTENDSKVPLSLELVLIIGKFSLLAAADALVTLYYF